MEQVVNTHYITAESFPDGVEETHQKLQALWPGQDRQSFGISYPDVYGRLIYHAAVERYAHECGGSECKSFLIRKGGFVTATLTDWKSQKHMITQVFQHLLKDDRIHPFGYCLEMYLSDDVVRCMVPLKTFGL